MVPRPMNSRTLAVFTAVLALIGLLAYSLISDGRANLAVGQAAPDKSLPVVGGTGEQSLADYRGRWGLVNFWGSWCKPCRAEAPELEKLQRDRGGSDFTVLGIALNDNTDDVSDFVSEYGLTYPQLRAVDSDDRRNAWGMVGVPENFLVDPAGKIALIRRGELTQQFIDNQIVPILPGAPAAGGKTEK